MKGGTQLEGFQIGRSQILGERPGSHIRSAALHQACAKGLIRKPATRLTHSSDESPQLLSPQAFPAFIAPHGIRLALLLRSDLNDEPHSIIPQL